MRFRRREILFWEGQIFISVCLIVCIILMVFNKQYVSILLIPFVLLLVAFVLQFVLEKDYIIMNEKEISCKKGKQLYWRYQWSEIAELKIGNRFRNPSVEIVLKNDCINDNGRSETTEAYFQLGLAAKKAIKHYCKCPTTKGSVLLYPPEQMK